MPWRFSVRRTLAINAACAVAVWLVVTWTRMDRLANEYRGEADTHRLTAINLLLEARHLHHLFMEGRSRDFKLEEQSGELVRASDEHIRLAEAYEKKARGYRTAAYRLSGLILCDPGEISSVDDLDSQ